MRIANWARQNNTEPGIRKRPGHVDEGEKRGKGMADSNLSYQCSKGKHGQCAKLKCPCECHNRNVK